MPTAGNIDIVGQNRGEHRLLLAGAGYRWGSNGEEYVFGAGGRVAW